MDPYLEAHWRDVHASLVIYSRDAIQRQLPDPLRARVEERVLLESDDGFDRASFNPDVRIFERQPGRRNGTKSATALMSEPVLVPGQYEPLREGYIEIIDPSTGNRVVTVVEFLSPTNKWGGGREQYLRKQAEIRLSKTNLVEIDLVRSGEHTVAFQMSWLLRPEHRTTYYACVRRVTRTDAAEVYPIPLGDRLPTIRIPLRETDNDIPLDLQAMIDLCYENGAYAGTLNYLEDPEPEPTKREAAWIESWLQNRGIRPKPKRRRRKSR